MRLTSRTDVKSSGASWCAGLVLLMPALLTRTCTSPSSPAACDTSAVQSSGRETSVATVRQRRPVLLRSEEHTSELQSLMRISYAVFCLKKKNNQTPNKTKIQ